MCNRVFCIAFFGIYGVYAPTERVVSAASGSSSMDNEVGKDRRGSLGKNGLVAISPTSSLEEEILGKITKLELENRELKEKVQEIDELKEKVQDLQEKQLGMEALKFAKPFTKDELFYESAGGIHSLIDYEKLNALARDTDNLIRFEATKRIYQDLYEQVKDSKDVLRRENHKRNVEMLTRHIVDMKALIQKRKNRFYGRAEDDDPFNFIRAAENYRR